jgi:NadR type nicotinamide-nucleotide adenylyltransferase
MAEALAKYFQTVCVPEYGREYAEKKLPKIDVSSVPTYEWRSEEFEHIAIEQAQSEDRLAREANRVLICDTDAVATSVWHERYMGSRSQVVEEFARKRKYDLYLLTDCDIDFVQDGTRDGERVRAWMTRRFAERLQERGARWMKLSGSHDIRMKTAVAACQHLLGRFSIHH